MTKKHDIEENLFWFRAVGSDFDFMEGKLSSHIYMGVAAHIPGSMDPIFSIEKFIFISFSITLDNTRI